jgi:hypothetical protein
MTQPMSKELAVELLADLRLGVEMDGKHLPDAADKLAALDLAISALRQGEGGAVAEVCRPAHPNPDSATFVRMLRDNIPDGTKLYAHPPTQAGSHCSTCTCNPNMTPAIRFDVSTAMQEGAVRDKLIELGWTPPAQASTQPERPQGGVVDAGGLSENEHLAIIIAACDEVSVAFVRKLIAERDLYRAETIAFAKEAIAEQPAPAVGEAEGVALKPSTILEALRRTWKRWGYTEDEMKARAVDSSTDISLLWDMGKLSLTPPLPVERKEGERG